MAVLTVSDEQRRWRMAHRHRLIAVQRIDDVATIADDLVGLHSSDPATVYLSALVRMDRPSIESIDEALYEQRSVLRHHAMRRTIWVMTPAIARLAHGAATAKIARAERRKTIKALINGTEPGAISDAEAWFDDAHGQLAGLLETQGGQTTRRLGQVLPALTVPVTFGWKTKHPGSLKAHTKVLQGGGFDGTYVRGRPTGNWTSSEYAWHLTQQWLTDPIAGLDETPAAAELLQRWLPQFGPATEVDISWWFGWTKTLTRTSLATVGAVEVQLQSGAPAWLAAHDLEPVEDPGPWVRLLPSLDPTTMGWKEREWYLPAPTPGSTSPLYDRFGNSGPIVMIDGECRGPWGQRVSGEIVHDLGNLTAEHTRLLDDAIGQLGDAIGDVVVKPRFPSPAQRALL